MNRRLLVTFWSTDQIVFMQLQAERLRNAEMYALQANKSTRFDCSLLEAITRVYIKRTVVVFLSSPLGEISAILRWLESLWNFKRSGQRCTQSIVRLDLRRLGTFMVHRMAATQVNSYKPNI